MPETVWTFPEVSAGSLKLRMWYRRKVCHPVSAAFPFRSIQENRRGVRAQRILLVGGAWYVGVVLYGGISSGRNFAFFRIRVIFIVESRLTCLVLPRRKAGVRLKPFGTVQPVFQARSDRR